MKSLLITVLSLWCALTGLARAQDLSALARLDPARSGIALAQGGTRLTLGLSQPVPFRAYLLNDPARLVVDFREVDFDGQSPDKLLDQATRRGALITDLRWGRFRPGWSRLVAELAGPVKIVAASEATGDAPQVVVDLARTDAAAFATQAGAPSSALWDMPQPAAVDPPHPRQDGSRPLKVVLDPGHGGIDPGAENDALKEKVLTLTFARQLKESLIRAGMQVVMTREEDVFVPLETRVTVARASGADLFISLHADKVPEADVSGTTVYLFDPEDSDKAAQELAERHDRDDLLAGVDLQGHDDAVSGVLMDLARTETRPRTVRLAQVLAGAIKAEHLKMNPHPVKQADFSVLKAADIPSVLIELGFLSSAEDRTRLLDDTWRKQMAQAITEGVQNWAKADAAEARLLRQ